MATNKNKNLVNDVSPELSCRREVQERIVAALGGKRKARGLRCIQAGATNPTGETMKAARRLKNARVKFADAWRTIIAPQAKGVARMYGVSMDTDEFEPPQAA